MTTWSSILTLLLLLLAGRLTAQRPEGKIVDTERKFNKEIRHKAHVYENRISRRTEKTLIHLSKWEAKVQQTLHSVSPETEQKLFADPKLTFQYLLNEYRQGFTSVEKMGQHYDAYLDQVSTTTHYFEEQSEAGWEHISQTREQLDALKKQAGQAEYIKTFIQQRKKQLIAGSLQYMGKSEALRQISKEGYYYTEALNNYKALFSEPGEAEEAVRRALNEIPAFQNFVRQNSQLASMFRIPGSGNTGGGSSVNVAGALAGLQTRTDVQNMIRERIAAGGPNAAVQIQQNLSEAQAKLTELKDKLLKGGVMGSDGEIDMPDFKPNSQKAKTLWQRMEYGFDIQFAKNNGYLPSTTDLGVSLGYRLNDRSSIGGGLSYKLGLGSIDNIRISSEGIGLRSYLDWKIKGQWYATGGYELNYMSSFKNVSDLKNAAWQRSGLIGVSRQYKAGKKMKGQIKLMYDFMARRQHPKRSPIVMRMGYKL